MNGSTSNGHHAHVQESTMPSKFQHTPLLCALSISTAAGTPLHVASSFSSSSSSSSSSSPFLLSNYINGQFVPASCDEWIDDLEPSTSQLLCRIPRSRAADVESAVAAAKAAYPAWAALAFEARARLLDAVSAAIERRLPELAALESRDAGKSLAAAKAIDIPRAVSNFRFFAGQIRHDATASHWMHDALNVTQRQPLGVAGLITPWNLPLYLLSWKVAPALAMGNTVVCKPSELTPLTASALAEIMHEVGLPPGVFNVLHGYGPEVGQPLLAHPSVPLISFTGGTLTGRTVAATCAPLFKKLSLELGGKNAGLVFADCDFEATVATCVRAAFTNAGQVCLCSSRLYVEKSLYPRFLEAFVKATQALVVNDPEFAQVGALTSLAHRAKIEKYVELGRQTPGAVIECGGQRPTHLSPLLSQGSFYMPTIITGLPHDHPCIKEEIFGPVVTVVPFESEEEALHHVNDSSYGLAGTLFTSNMQRATRITRQWQTGMVWVNTWLHRDLRVPFGGIKESGLGFEGGHHSLEFYSNYKNICFKF